MTRRRRQTSYRQCRRRFPLGLGMTGTCVLAKGHDGECAETIDPPRQPWPPGNGDPRSASESKPRPA